MNLQDLMAGGADDGSPDAGEDQGADPLISALDSLKDQIDAIEAQIMQSKKPGTPPAPGDAGATPLPKGAV